MKTICDNCRYKLKTWSEELREEYRGCGFFLKDDAPEISDDMLVNYVDAEVVAKGWICNGVMAFNNQLITKNTRSCKLGGIKYEYY